MREFARNQHPQSAEKLTANQEQLLSLLFDTTTVAPIRRRVQQTDGYYRFEKIEREVPLISFAQDETEFALKIHETDPDAPLSPLYINLRNLNDEVLEQIQTVFTEQDIPKTDVVIGIPNAGVKLAEIYSRATHIPVLPLLRKEETPTERRVVSDKKRVYYGESATILDDLASHGNSKLEAIREVEAVGVWVEQVVVLIDRQQGAGDLLKQQGYPFMSMLTLTDIVDFGIRTGRITPEQYHGIHSYVTPPNE
jgi:orotate phosphoribosyltransferase